MIVLIKHLQYAAMIAVRFWTSCRCFVCSLSLIQLSEFLQMMCLLSRWEVNISEVTYGIV